ncbi:MAG: hypothetical protein NT128_00955, partial [Proteobacteria bacterium]|nr:hypothetical protein [Pseudomonadota bacterium]
MNTLLLGRLTGKWAFALLLSSFSLSSASGGAAVDMEVDMEERATNSLSSASGGAAVGMEVDREEGVTKEFAMVSSAKSEMSQGVKGEAKAASAGAAVGMEVDMAEGVTEEFAMVSKPIEPIEPIVDYQSAVLNYEDLLAYIICFLPAEDKLLRITQVCVLWKDVASSKPAWRDVTIGIKKKYANIGHYDSGLCEFLIRKDLLGGVRNLKISGGNVYGCVKRLEEELKVNESITSLNLGGYLDVYNRIYIDVHSTFHSLVARILKLNKSITSLDLSMTPL